MLVGPEQVFSFHKNWIEFVFLLESVEEVHGHPDYSVAKEEDEDCYSIYSSYSYNNRLHIPIDIIKTRNKIIIKYQKYQKHSDRNQYNNQKVVEKHF